MTLCLRTDTGEALPLDLDRWNAPATADEQRLLAGVAGPVLDVGCGPGRHVLALGLRGIPVLGIDASPSAVDLARSRGATALLRSVFDRIPGAGRWRTALLFDGNIGIGGDPVALVARVASLLAPLATLLVEVEPPGTGLTALSVRIDDGHDRSAPFAWGRVGVDGVDLLCRSSGTRLVELRETGDRWFAFLECGGAGDPPADELAAASDSSR